MLKSTTYSDASPGFLCSVSAAAAADVAVASADKSADVE